MNLLDVLFPISCLNCGQGNNYICDFCLSKVTKPKQFCLACIKPSIDGVTHARCKKKLLIDGVYALWTYEGVVRRAILKLKYTFVSDLACELANKCLGKLKSDTLVLPKNALLIPIPLHSLRKKWRGFNQSEDVGKLIAADMGWKYAPDLLVRTKVTKPQTDLKGKERIANIRGIFKFNPKYKLVSTTIILFDDVLTTGSTLKEAAKVLKRNEAKFVYGLTIAS